MIGFQRLKALLIVFGDLLVFELALFLSLWLRYGDLDIPRWEANFLPFSVLAVVWVVCFYIIGLYNLALLREPVRLFRTYVEAMLANLVIGFGFFYLLPFGLTPRAVLLVHFSVSLLLGYAWRIAAGRLIPALFSHGRVLFVGPAEEVQRVDTLIRDSALGLELVAAIATSGEPYRHAEIKWATGLHAYSDTLKQEQISAVVLGVRPDEFPELKKELYKSLFTPVTILDRAELEEATTARIPLSHVTETWFLHHLKESEKTWYETAKRTADILLSLPFGILTLVLMPFVFVATKISSPGPIFYTQSRVGKGGKLFTIIKFRSMRLDAEKNGAQFTRDAKTDPRLFAWGRFMRMTRIDELPQVWNVLKGDLSFIGPRPERPEFTAPLEERMPHYALRHLTRPGLTGWAQVMFLTPTSSLEDNLKKLQYDLYYIKHRSLFLDALILLRTVGIVIRRQGT